MSAAIIPRFGYGERTAADAKRREEHDARLLDWRIENRRAQCLPDIYDLPPSRPAEVVAVESPPSTALAAPSPPTAADREFDAVRATALARIETEAKLLHAETNAVAAILSAGPSAPSSLDTQSPEDLAVAAILRAGPSPR